MAFSPVIRSAMARRMLSRLQYSCISSSSLVGHLGNQKTSATTRWYHSEVSSHGGGGGLPSYMRAAVFWEPNQPLTIEEFHIPRPKAGEILIKTKGIWLILCFPRLGHLSLINFSSSLEVSVVVPLTIFNTLLRHPEEENVVNPNDSSK